MRLVVSALYVAGLGLVRSAGPKVLATIGLKPYMFPEGNLPSVVRAEIYQSDLAGFGYGEFVGLVGQVGTSAAPRQYLCYGRSGDLFGMLNIPEGSPWPDMESRISMCAYVLSAFKPPLDMRALFMEKRATSSVNRNSFKLVVGWSSLLFEPVNRQEERSNDDGTIVCLPFQVTATRDFESPRSDIAWNLPDEIADPPCLKYTYKHWLVKPSALDLVECTDTTMKIKGGWIGLANKPDDLKIFCDKVTDYIVANPALRQLIGEPGKAHDHNIEEHHQMP